MHAIYVDITLTRSVYTGDRWRESRILRVTYRL